MRLETSALGMGRYRYQCRVSISAPTARPHTSLGQRPRFTHQTGLGLKARAILLAMMRKWHGPSALETYPAKILGRCPRLVWGRAFGAQEIHRVAIQSSSQSSSPSLWMRFCRASEICGNLRNLRTNLFVPPP